jgi:hypothetical protein
VLRPAWRKHMPCLAFSPFQNAIISALGRFCTTRFAQARMPRTWHTLSALLKCLLQRPRHAALLANNTVSETSAAPGHQALHECG